MTGNIPSRSELAELVAQQVAQRLIDAAMTMQEMGLDRGAIVRGFEIAAAQLCATRDGAKPN